MESLIIYGILCLPLWGIICLMVRIFRGKVGNPLRYLALAFVMVVVAATILGMLLGAIFGPSNGQSPTSKCRGNLHQMGIAMKMYAGDNDERLPSKFSAVTNYLPNAKLFICPASDHLPGALSDVDRWSDYCLVAGLTESDPAGCVYAFCPPENHDGKAAIVLRLDGSMEWYETDKFIALTNNPALFFATTDKVELAKLQSRAKIVRGSGQIKKRQWPWQTKEGR